MGIFDKEDSVSRKKMRLALRRSSISRVGTGGKKYTRKERISFEKELFPYKYGKQISKKEYRTVLEKIRRTKFGKSAGERMKIQRKIDALKKFGFKK